MLAVIDKIAGVRIRERICAPAERRFSFEHRDTDAPLRQRNRRAEPSKPGPDDDRMFHRRRHLVRIAPLIYPRSAPKRPTAHARPTR